MNINEHIAKIIAKPTAKTQPALEIGGDLLMATNYAKIISEGEVIEIGSRLYWRNDQLTPGKKFTRGIRAHVDFLKENSAEKPDFIGTFHTHPYARRFGPQTSVGFSASDIGAFNDEMPKAYKAMANFVFSNKHIYLALFRANTKVDRKELLAMCRWGNFPDTAASYMKLSDKKKSVFDDYVKKIQAVESTDQDETQKRLALNALEQELTTKVPKYPGLLMTHNMEMNIDFANRYKYDFYQSEQVGAVDGKTTITLKLMSNPSNVKEG
jgi:hypothetical protein